MTIGILILSLVYGVLTGIAVINRIKRGNPFTGRYDGDTLFVITESSLIATGLISLLWLIVKTWNIPL